MEMNYVAPEMEVLEVNTIFCFFFSLVYLILYANIQCCYKPTEYNSGYKVRHKFPEFTLDVNA